MRQSLEARLGRLEAAQAGPARSKCFLPRGRGDGSDGWSTANRTGRQ